MCYRWSLAKHHVVLWSWQAMWSKSTGNYLLNSLKQFESDQRIQYQGETHVRTSDKLVCLWQSPQKFCSSWDYWPDQVVHHLLPKSSMVDQYVKGHCLLRSKLRNLCLYYSHVIILLMMVSVDFRCPSMRPWASRWLRTRTRPAAPPSPTSTLSPSFSSAHFWSVPTYIHSFLHR